MLLLLLLLLLLLALLSLQEILPQILSIPKTSSVASGKGCSTLRHRTYWLRSRSAEQNAASTDRDAASLPAVRRGAGL
jgi:hypothetical protein